jgi:D-alanyl-D-alanine carboxypeptidase
MSFGRPHLASLASLLIFLCACAGAAAGPRNVPRDDARASRIDSEVQALLDRFHTPGAAVEVMVGDRVVYTRAFGARDVARGLRATLETEVEIGSITKQVTAAAILQLEDAGRLDIDSSLATYLPRAPHAREVTLRQLLTHTSGLPDYFTSCADIATLNSFDAVIGSIANKPLEFVPGSRWRYSNTGYILLGRVIEAVSGESYNRYVRTHLLDPAGMAHTFTLADEPRVPGMSVGYDSAHGGPRPAPRINEAAGWSAGDLVATVGDLQRWNAALADGRVITARSFRVMSTSATSSDGKPTHYGLGLFVDSLEGQPRIGHTGHSCGFAAEDEYLPRQQARIVVLTNSVDGPAESIVTVLVNVLFPDVAIAAERTAPGENQAMTNRIKAFAMPLLDGRVIRSELTDAESAELSDAAAVEAFTRYGAPSAFIFKGTLDRNFGPVYIYWLRFGDDIERLMLQFERASDKINAVQLTPPSQFGAKR